MLLERQHVAVFILLLLLFTSREGPVPSGEAFFGRFLLTLPRVRAPSLLARHFPENLAVFASYEESAAERAPNKEESFTGHYYVLTNKMPNA